MSSSKTNKATKKRVKVRKDSFETRSVGHGHFKGKETGRVRAKRRNSKKVVLTKKVVQRNLPHA